MVKVSDRDPSSPQAFLWCVKWLLTSSCPLHLVFTSGEVISEKDRCKKCEGKKVVKEVKILEVHVDKGMKHGQKITFGGEADQAPGVEPGDIVLVLQGKEHEVSRPASTLKPYLSSPLYPLCHWAFFK